MQFSEVIGQAALKQQLVQLISQNRLSHALLFLGKEGTGALSLARAMAQYTVCETVNGRSTHAGSSSLFSDEDLLPPTNETLPDSCGKCAACLKAAALVHPDIHFSYPVISKKPGDKPVSTDFIAEWREFTAEQPYGNAFDWLQFIGADNKQGNITAHECADIIRKMSLKSFESEYKILVMWMPELLGKEGNKLLKLIEEPPPNTLFILVAENDSLILPTILSRMQLVRVPPLQPAEISLGLQDKQHFPAAQADQLAALSEGNYRQAMREAAHAGDDWEVTLRDWLNTIIKTGPAAQVKWIDEIAKTGREKQKQFLRYFTHMLELALRLRILGPDDPLRPEAQDQVDFALRLNRLCDVYQQEAIINELDNASYYIERNAHAKMLFHALTIRLYHIISNKSVILMQ